jgi:hypothetical protein
MSEPIQRMEVFTGRSEANQVCRGEGGDSCRELRRERDGLWCRTPPRFDTAAAVHLAAAGQVAGRGGAPKVKTRQRVRRPYADGIELEIGGVDIRIGSAAKPQASDAVISRAQGELVIGPSGNIRVLVATNPVDFRRGSDGLAALVRETMRTDRFSGVGVPGEAGLTG